MNELRTLTNRESAIVSVRSVLDAPETWSCFAGSRESETDSIIGNTAKQGGLRGPSGSAQRANFRGVPSSQIEKSTPGGIRTPNPRFRRPMRYPVVPRVLGLTCGMIRSPCRIMDSRWSISQESVNHEQDGRRPGWVRAVFFCTGRGFAFSSHCFLSRLPPVCEAPSTQFA